MTAGYQVTQADVDNRAGDIAIRVRESLEDAADFKGWLDTQTDAALIALGFAQADVNTLRSALGDLNQLETIYIGQTTLGTAKDFRTFAKLLTGVL